MQYFYPLIFLLFFSFQVHAEIPVPELKGRVTDLSGVLTDQEINSLKSKLENLETKKGSQLVILILPTTDGESIEQFSFRVVEKWKIGRKKINDGVLILVAKDDRKMRIEVGYGLEGVLPDAVCKRIISEQMRPNFKDKKYFEGIDIAVDSISKSIDGEALPPPSKKKKDSQTSSDDPISGVLMVSILIIIFGSSLTSSFASSSAGRWMGSGIFSSIGTVILMGLLATGGSSILFIIFAGIMSFILYTLLIYWWSNRSGSGGGSSWSSSSGSSWGSSSSSDSFSSGGGDFGGGGASGDW